MNMDLKNITGALILVIGVLAFFFSIFNHNFNFAIIYLIASLILWVLYGLLLNAFKIHQFGGIISVAGFLVAISVLFMYGIEEVPYPAGAIIFHSGGFAGALGIGFFSLFPILIIHQMRTANVKDISEITEKLADKDPEMEIINEEWEIASDDDLQSGDFETV